MKASAFRQFLMRYLALKKRLSIGCCYKQIVSHRARIRAIDAEVFMYSHSRTLYHCAVSRWNVQIETSEGLENMSMINYLGVGIDAAIALDFHLVCLQEFFGVHRQSMIQLWADPRFTSRVFVSTRIEKKIPTSLAVARRTRCVPMIVSHVRDRRNICAVNIAHNRAAT
jgi:hypothetical protein